MITKIKKIKNFGIFKNYTCDKDLSDFKKFNLFYGWNGSGKTTLSELFNTFNSGTHSEFQNLEYEFESETELGKEVLFQDNKYQTKIRVFNQKYIEDNIEIVAGKAKSIFILGAENKKLSNQIREDEEKLTILKKKKGELETLTLSKETEKGKIFTNVGSVIGATAAGSAVRNYNARNAKEDFNELDVKKLLEEHEVTECQTILKQEQKDKLGILEFKLNLEREYKEIIDLLKKTVVGETITRLKENDDISKWVEDGIKLREFHKRNKCEFCDNEISEIKLIDLANHFNEADKNFKNEINAKILDLNNSLFTLKNIKPADKVFIYKELHTTYTSRLTTFNQERENLALEITTLIKELDSKKTKTTEDVPFTRSLNNNFFDSLVLLNEAVQQHNDKTDNFQVQKDSANLKLKNHYLSKIFDDVRTIDCELENYSIEITNIQNGTDDEIGITNLSEQISYNKSFISSVHKGEIELNTKLHTFLGRDEIKFVVSDEEGYLIKRNGKTAKNLSEGEKTAIAFIYFIVHLQDENFDMEKGIIVIDDPISSLDSNSLFQAFSFLKNSVKDSQQIFILTHNFDFFKLIHDWFKFHRNDAKRYMIKNKYDDSNERVASISKIDSFLIDYNTEYEFLLRILFQFNKNKGDDKIIEDVYHIPNIGRKVLETFLMFRIPNAKGLSAKVQMLEEEDVFDKNKLTAINKFFNNQSHITGRGFDPSLVQETEKNVEYLLQMIEALFPAHYKILEEQFNND